MDLNVNLLEASFHLLTPRANELADRFYSRLFARHPQLRSLFPAELSQQKRKLISALAMIVQNLRYPEELTAMAEGLAQRHSQYGVKREQYPLVGAVLLESLQDVAGDLWTSEMYDAWAGAYGGLQELIFAALDRQERQAA